MMGQKMFQPKGHYAFSLDDRVPADHLLRQVAAVVDFSFVRRLTARFYSHVGQPSVDPVVLVKMALIGYLYGITSERRLAEDLRLNLAYMWFLGYDLDEQTPDHAVLSKARRRFGLTIYQAFFTEIVRQCGAAGLIVGQLLYADSTLVRANASHASVGSRTLLAQLATVDEHVAQLWRDNPGGSPGLPRRARRGTSTGDRDPLHYPAPPQEGNGNACAGGGTGRRAHPGHLRPARGDRRARPHCAGRGCSLCWRSGGCGGRRHPSRAGAAPPVHGGRPTQWPAGTDH